MNCQNHSFAAAVATCAGCAEPFCANCVVPLGGNHYCGGCKSMALPAVAVAITRESEEAQNALKYAIIGIFCFGIILQPMAIAAALRARKEIAADPSVGGKGKATAALIISCVVLLFWVLGIMSGVNKKHSP